ncbi:MAG TPA: RluA family pseudouridine synthase [Bacteroidota bacterium]|nr:RluA family pseudouridine synthase [Bacteroidota bacterium]
MAAVTEADARQRIHIVVPPGQSRERIDRYLSRSIQNATRSKVHRGITQGDVLVNGGRVKPSYLVQPRDEILITLPHPPPPDVRPENIPLDIVFEDASLIIVNKPAGMVTHPAYGHYEGTLVNALLFHCRALRGVDDGLRPGIVHRLDKDTTGLLVVAKTSSAHVKLAKQFAQHTVEREYRAIVWGSFRGERGRIEASLGRSKSDRKKVAVTESGKAAVTEYTVLRRLDFLTLVSLQLKTGRTHQIRVHLAHAGHPVFGDPTYGGRTAAWGGLRGNRFHRAANLLKGISRQALHAKTLGFIHPETRKLIRFDSDLPADMAAIIRALGK